MKFRSVIRPMLPILLVIIPAADVFAQPEDQIAEPKAIVDHYRFTGDYREESMWSALYGARSGKIYIGLCTHAEAAHLYEFDPETEQMRHIVDLTDLHEERGKGINTNGKIHVRMGEDNDGNIYFAGLNEDTGPEAIDPSSYLGAFWYRYNPKLDKVEVLGRISRHFGLLGMVMDRSPHYSKIGYQFDAMCTGADGTIFIGESDRRAKLFFYIPGGSIVKGMLNPTNPR